MPDLFRVPDARPDAMAVVLHELRTRTGESLRDLQRAIGHAVGRGIGRVVVDGVPHTLGAVVPVAPGLDLRADLAIQAEWPWLGID